MNISRTVELLLRNCATASSPRGWWHQLALVGEWMVCSCTRTWLHDSMTPWFHDSVTSTQHTGIVTSTSQHSQWLCCNLYYATTIAAKFKYGKTICLIYGVFSILCLHLRDLVTLTLTSEWHWHLQLLWATYVPNLNVLYVYVTQLR